QRRPRTHPTMAASRRTPTTPTINPPPGAFSVSQRLLRGYGPLAVFAVLLLLMATLVPSKAPQSVSSSGDANLNSGSAGDTSDTVAGTDGTTDTSAGPGGGATSPGQQASAGGVAGKKGVGGTTGGATPGAPQKGAPVAAGVRPCPDRKD